MALLDSKVSIALLVTHLSHLKKQACKARLEVPFLVSWRCLAWKGVSEIFLGEVRKEVCPCWDL